MTHRNTSGDIKTGAACQRREQHGRNYLLVMRCPAYRRRDSSLGFRTELENLVGHDKGKGTSGSTARPKVPMGQPGADCSVIPMKWC